MGQDIELGTYLYDIFYLVKYADVVGENSKTDAGTISRIGTDVINRW